MLNGGRALGAGACTHTRAMTLYTHATSALARALGPKCAARASGRAGGRQADSPFFCALHRALPSMPRARGCCRDFVLSSPAPLVLAVQTLGGSVAGGLPPAPPAVTLFSLLLYCHVVLTCMEEVHALHKRTNAFGERGAHTGSPARERVSAFAVCCCC